MWDQVNDALSESVGRVLTGLAGFLPGAAAFMVAVLVAAAIGWLWSAACGGVLRWFHFDRRLERMGFETLAEWSPARSPTLLARRVVFWATLLFGTLVGLAALDATLASTMAGRLLTYLPNVFVAMLVLAAGSILARFLSRSVLISAVNMQLQASRLISLGVKWLVLVLTGAMALNHLSIGGTILTLAFGITFGGIVLALSLAVGLGSKDIVSRTLERQAEKRPEPAEPPVRPL